MSELILHHYDISPYAAKIRRAFGLKGLPWRSVQIPMLMPKPDLTALTGGYRRTPTLQIGADLYCDTKGIAPVLDRVRPAPPLVPEGQELVEYALSRWGETAFMMGVTAFFGLGFFDDAFIEDRKDMVPPGTDVRQAHRVLGTKLAQLKAHLARLEQHLGDDRPFLLGEEPGLADLSCDHPLRFLGFHPTTRELLAEAPRVRAWSERLDVFGEGERKEMNGAEAVEIARQATPADPPADPAAPPPGLDFGAAVLVLPEEPGSGVVAGTLEPSGLHEIAVRRRDERAGEVVVHFPRDGYAAIEALK